VRIYRELPALAKRSKVQADALWEYLRRISLAA
jgi:hypothetical protein